MKKNQICVIALTAFLTLSLMSIISIQPASADVEADETLEIPGTGMDWYHWDSWSNRYSAIVLYDGDCNPNYAEIDSLDDQYTDARMEFIEDLDAMGYDVLTPAETCTYSSTNNAWLTNASDWLKTQGPGLVTLFGWGAGGTAAAFEIQKEHAEAYYSCAVIADALVYAPSGGWDAIYYTCNTAGNTKVSTAFISNPNDLEYGGYAPYYTYAYLPMYSYYNNMPAGLKKEWHTWNTGADAHDPFPDTCGDHTDETVVDVAYNFEITVEDYDAIVNIEGVSWYRWGDESDSVAILLFGGPPEDSWVTSLPFGSASSLKFIHELHASGIDVIALRLLRSYSTGSTWLNDTATAIRNKSFGDYDNICVFGHSAGGVIVGHAIQQTGADWLYDAAIIACAPVNWTTDWEAYFNESPTYPLYHTADYAGNAKVRTSFIKADDLFKDQVMVYYDNFNSSFDKELHHWSNDEFDSDAHDIFPDEGCYTHPGETLADVVYNWLMHPYQLTVEAYNQYMQPGYGISVYIDGDYAGTTFNNYELTHGKHTIEVESPVGTSVFEFYLWQGSTIYDNPGEIWLNSTSALYAWYGTY